jgi:hypothetical protein
MEYISEASIGYAVGVIIVAFITYLKGKSEGRREGIDMGINATIDRLRHWNMVRWEYDEDGDINLLDINGNEVGFDE